MVVTYLGVPQGTTVVYMPPWCMREMYNGGYASPKVIPVSLLVDVEVPCASLLSVAGL